MEYNFVTETYSGSNNETNLSVSNSCETMCAALSLRVGLPLSPLLTDASCDYYLTGKIVPVTVEFIL